MTGREWMYSGWSPGQAPSNEWIENTNIFLDRAFSMLSLVENDTIKCPCAKCRNYVRHKRFDVEMHLCKHGFRDDYRIWTSHGEGHIEAGSDESLDEADRMDDMLVDLANANPPTIDDEPTASAQAFYRMVSSADQPVHESTTHTTLSAVARLLALKSHYNMSIAHFEANLELLNEITDPTDLEFLSKLTTPDEGQEDTACENTYDEDEDNQDEEDPDDLPEHLAYDPDDY